MRYSFQRLYFTLLLLGIYCHTLAQDNYEIQVYGAETVQAHKTMFELHSNFTSSGSHTTVDGVLPSNHVFHETVEITHGWNAWFETGFYFFNSIGDNGRSAYVGSHIRPRVAVPEKWKWPIGLSLSLEFGFQKAAYAANTSTLEIRPIIDKKMGVFYISLNPTLEKSFQGPQQHQGLIFSPNIKASIDCNKQIAAGIEYYGSTGPFFKYDQRNLQQHQLFVALDLNVSPVWEFNAGFGLGFTPSTDRSIIKMIVGRRF